VWREPIKEVKVDVSWDRGRYFSDYASDLARNFPGYRVVVHIPFEGDAGVFSLRPSSFTFNPPRGRVNEGEEYLGLDPGEASDRFTATLSAGTYAVEWYSVNGRETMVTDEVKVEGSSAISFSAPFEVAGPSVLYLKRVGR
jgi:hypothetical protein